jgi:hypothetical protein
MRNHQPGRLDHAIDRAVRGMMEIDPPTGLRHRVSYRLSRERAKPLLVAAFAAVALMVLFVASWMALRQSGPGRPAEPAIALATHSQPATSQSQPATSTAPATVSAPTPSTLVAPREHIIVTRPRRIPRPSAIFTGPRDRVTAASLTPPPVEPANDTSDAATREVVSPAVSPIRIAPITIAPIVIAPLRIPPITDRK